MTIGYEIARNEVHISLKRSGHRSSACSGQSWAVEISRIF